MSKKKSPNPEFSRAGLYALDQKGRVILRRELCEALSQNNDLQAGQESSAIVAPTGDCFYLGTQQQIEQRLQKIPDLNQNYLSFINKYYAICPLSAGQSNGSLRMNLSVLISCGLLQRGDLVKMHIELGRESPMILLFPIRRKNRGDIEFVLRDRVLEKLNQGDGLTIDWDHAKMQG